MRLSTNGCNFTVKTIVCAVFGVHFFLVFLMSFQKEAPRPHITVRTMHVAKVQPQVVAVAKKGGSSSGGQRKKGAAAFKPPPSALLQEIQNNLALLDPPTSTKKTPLVMPKELPPEEENPQYGELLVAHLQNILELPEQGDVTVDLEVDRKGRVVHVEILTANSPLNSAFLKKRLPELMLPCFNGSHETVVFTVVFTHLDPCRRS
jgi:hypothetical protein